MLTGKSRDFTAAALEAETRTQEFVARRAVAAAAARAHVAYAFRIARGQVDAEVLNAADSGDLLVLGTGDRTPWGGTRLDPAAHAAGPARSAVGADPEAGNAGRRRPAGVL